MDDLLWIGPALIAGICAARFGLPPMIGYLICGFTLNFSGIYDHDRLSMIGNLGVTLLLFTIGLKLDLRSLLRPVIWAGATIHTAIVVAVMGTLLYWVSLAGFEVFANLDIGKAMLIGFALSFSSTVFAVKTLEEKGEYNSKYGQTAIGILIMQDILAVLFLAFSTGTLPSMWALSLFLLIPLRFIPMRLLCNAGHSSELQILYGIALAFGSYSLFDAVGVKGDLGALIMGSMLATHPLAGAVSKRLVGFKDLLLVGFFLSIGMSGNLTIAAIFTALLLTGLVVFKAALFFIVFTRYKFRARTATLASLTLANYSEFGLIVGAIAVSNVWLSEDWLVIIALALTMTIIVAAPINCRARQFYYRLRPKLTTFETESILPEDEVPDIGNARIIVVGMGRLGTSVYDQLAPHYGELLVGVDSEPEVVAAHISKGRHVVCADATDDEKWERTTDFVVDMGILALKRHHENLGILKTIRKIHKNSVIFAVAKHDDEIDELLAEGAQVAHNMYSEAGVGLATDVVSYYGETGGEK